MSDRGSRDRQVMTLLVQLFGRDVMDRLAGAGFDAPAVMARASAERLAAEAGIPIAIARRVAIVVEESPAPAPKSTAATQPKPAAASPKPVAAPATPPGPAAQTEPATRSASAARTEPASKSDSVARTEPVRQPDSATRTASSARSKPVERTEVGQAESEMLMDFAAPPEPATRAERRPAKAAARKREPRVSVEPIAPRTQAAQPPPAPPQFVAPPAVAPPAIAPPAEPASPPATASSTAVVPSAAAATSASSSVHDSIPEEGDPFVDDVALVSWMGLSSHQPDGRLAFTVSDTILDPVAESAPGREEADANRPADPERPRPAAAPVEAPARPSTISGSFWTFGRPADQTPPTTGRKPESQPPASSPRRRKHDGH